MFPCQTDKTAKIIRNCLNWSEIRMCQLDLFVSLKRIIEIHFLGIDGDSFNWLPVL